MLVACSWGQVGKGLCGSNIYHYLLPHYCWVPRVDGWGFVLFSCSGSLGKGFCLRMDFPEGSVRWSSDKMHLF